MRNIFFVLIIGFFVVFIFSVKTSFAASTTIGFSPDKGSFGKPFSVDLVIDGHGDKFNATQATVTPSSNLAIKDLSLGDCNFSFLKTPTIQNPSFAGIIISTYANKCTAYTLTLVPVKKGTATILLSKGSVKRYGDAANILSSINDASYNLTAALKDPQVLGTQTLQNNRYAVNLTILNSENTPASDVTVTLNSVSNKNNQTKNTDPSGKVQFTNIKKGIYEAIVMKNNTKIGANIINVSGTNHVLALSINLAAQKNNSLLKTGSLLNSLASNPLFIGIALLIGIALGIGVTILILKLKNKKIVIQ